LVSRAAAKLLDYLRNAQRRQAYRTVDRKRWALRK
jgi:hypothetical protein